MDARLLEMIQDAFDQAARSRSALEHGPSGTPYDDSIAAQMGAQVMLPRAPGRGGRFTQSDIDLAQAIGGGFVGSLGKFGDLPALFHGSPEAGLTHLRASTRGPLGPGTYATPAPQIARGYYAGEGGTVYQIPQSEGLDIYTGAGHRTDAEYYKYKNDKARLLAAAEPENRQAIKGILDRMGASDGYPIYQRIYQEVYKDEGAAQDLFKRAGFHGISGQIDGPETLIFGDVPLHGDTPWQANPQTSVPYHGVENERQDRAAWQRYDINAYKGLYPYDYDTMPTRNGRGDVIDDPATRGIQPTELRGPRPGAKHAGFFSDDPEVANRFAAVVGGDRAAVMPARLRMENPLVIDANGKPAAAYQFDAVAREHGTQDHADAFRSVFDDPNSPHDGVILQNTRDEGTVYVPKTAQQVRSRFAQFQDPTSGNALAGIMGAAGIGSLAPSIFPNQGAEN